MINYFLSNGVNNPPLHALTNGVSGGNGVYAYGASSVFPDQHLSCGQLLGGRGVPGCGGADVDVHCGDAGESYQSGWGYAAIHGDGDLLGRQHAECHEPGDVEFVEDGGGDYQCQRAGDGGFRGHDDHFSGAGGCDQRHSAHGQGAADADVHCGDAGQSQHPGRSLSAVHGDGDLF